MDLAKRIVSSLVMIALVLSALIIGSWALVGLTILASLLMMFDISRAFSQGGYNVNVVLMLGITALVFPAVWFFDAVGYIVLCAASFCVLATYVIFEKHHDFKNALASLFMLVYPLLPATLFVLLSVYDVKNDVVTGKILLTSAAACACISDASAYFGGRFFGKKKLCPAISPKKTVAGSIAAVIGGGVCGAVLSLIFTSIQMPFVIWLLIGFACGILSQIGDLFASLLKRFCGVKDYGNYIPGHGGAMDRMDSIIPCTIFVIALAIGTGVL